jgi:hypothetical protein
VTLTNVAGCDSVATLVLTVKNTSSSTIRDTICINQLPYVWNGVTFTAAGTKTTTLTNANGCDSVITMILSTSGGIPSAPTTLTQTLVQNNCGARIYRYTASSSVNASGYAWILPDGVGGVTGVTVDSGDIASSRVIRLKYNSNLAALTTDSIKVRAYSDCGSSASKAFKLTNTAWTPLTSPSITATNLITNVCGGRKVRYSVPVPATTAGDLGFEWSFFGSTLGANATIDSGNINSRVIVVLFTSNAAAAVDDSVFFRYNYNNGCTYSNYSKAKINLTAFNVPAAPVVTATNVVTNVCSGRKVRYSVPVTPATTTTATAATGYEWSFVGNVMGSNAVIDSGSVDSRVIVVLFANNAAADASDSVKCRYTSNCGYSNYGKAKITLSALSVPLAPSAITATAVASNACGARLYRYAAPNLPIATTTAGAATGWLWSFTGTLGANAIIDSGSLTSQVIVVRYTSNVAAATGDSVKVSYSSNCGYSASKALKLTNTVLSAPLAPTSITATSVAPNACGARLYRYAAPNLPAATTTAGAATGWLWSFTGTLGANAVIDSGTVTSQVIVVKYTSNVAAASGDSVKVSYSSNCGYSASKALKLTNTALSSPLVPTTITITSVDPSKCYARLYRYAAPSLPATASGYLWSFTGTLGANATIDSGTVNSQVILVRYSVNVAAGAGDSVRLQYISGCGNSPVKAAKLTNTALAGCSLPVAKNSSVDAFEVSVYPNPSTTDFNIHLSGSGQEQSAITIFDVQGRLIRKLKTASNANIKLGNDFKAGVYFMEVRNGYDQKTIRLVKY